MKCEVVLPVKKAKSKHGTAKPVAHDLSDQITGHTVTVIPDPSGGCVTVRLSNLSASDSCTVSVYTTQGEAVFSSRPSTGNGEVAVRVDLSRQPVGVYLLKITVNGNTRTWKVTRK